VLNGRATNLNPIDERPVVTVEVGSLINALGDLADGAVLSRDCGVADHDLVGRAPAPETANRQFIVWAVPSSGPDIATNLGFKESPSSGTVQPSLLATRRRIDWGNAQAPEKDDPLKTSFLTGSFAVEPAGYSRVVDWLPYAGMRSMSTPSAKTHLVANAPEWSSKRARLDLAPRLP
jgi:hypothetical protein